VTTVTGEANASAIIVARIIGTVANRIMLNRIISAHRVAFSPGADAAVAAAQACTRPSGLAVVDDPPCHLDVMLGRRPGLVVALRDTHSMTSR
jgi:hypothetical protein